MATTYQTSIANDYLELRAELGAALFSLTELAIESNAPADTIQTLGNLQSGLREPFLFVVVGEVKAGKSSLLNALFGKEFCRVDVLPATDRVHVFRFGEQSRDVPLHPELTEHYQPVAFLRDFNVVDTPGTNAAFTQHQRITEQFAPLADLILFVFSVVNPWGASTWQFLEHLQRKWLKNVVFVVQQTDLREEREVEAVVQHLKQTAAGRFGQSFPVFAVSAKKAFLAKTSGVDKTRLWTESHFGPLEDYINEIVGSGEPRYEKLRNINRTARVILGDLATGTHDGERTAAADRAELDRFRETVEQHRDRAGGGVEAFVRGIDTAFARCEHQGEHQLRARLRMSARRLFGGDARWQRHFQRNFESMLHAALARQTEHAFDLLEGETRSLWTPLRESMRANLGAGARERLAADEPDFAEQRPRLVEKIEATTVEILTDEPAEQRLRASLESVTRALRLPFWLAAATLVVGGTLTGMHLLPLWTSAVEEGVVIALVAFGTVAVSRKRRAALEVYRALNQTRQAQLSEKVAGLIRQAIDAFYGRVAKVYAPAEAFCRAQEAACQPALARVDTLEKAFLRITDRL